MGPDRLQPDRTETVDLPEFVVDILTPAKATVILNITA